MTTKGGHLTDDEIFKEMSLWCCRKQRKAMLKDKAVRVAAEKIENEALEILQKEDVAAKKLDVAAKKLNFKELKALLLFFGMERKTITNKKVRELRTE